MDIPVMTSASAHGLRSAVGVYAKPGSPYMNSSKYPGGYIKKIVNTVSKSLSKKRKSTGECIILCKRNKSPYSGGEPPNQCFKTKNGKLKGIQSGGFPDGIGNNYEGSGSGCLESFSNGGEFSSKIKANEFFDESAALNESIFTGEVGEICRRVTGSEHESDSSISKSIATTSSCNPVVSDSDTNNNGDGISNSDKKITSSINDDSLQFEFIYNKIIGLSEEGGRRKSDQPNLKWQPKHSVTRRTTQIFREVLKVWQERFGSSPYLTTGQVSIILKELQLIPPNSEVQKSLERNGSDISFEEFCRFLAESGRRKFYDNGLPRTVSEPRKFGKNGSHQQTRRNRKLSKAMCKYDVFLGGSCNPTTWRADIAIPDLKEMGITYFNPQVSQWRPELLEVEYHAKENAAVMFFVIDNQTRGISALIEVAHIAGSKRNLILVIQSYTREEHIISGEIVSQEECDDLRNGQEVLRDLVDSQGIPVFENIRIALKYTEKLLRRKSTGDDAEGNDEFEGTRREHQPKRIQPREVFDSLAISENRKLSLTDVCFGLRLLSEGKETPPVDTEKIAQILGVSCKSGAVEEENVSFERFSSLVTTFGYSRDDAESLQGSGLYLIPKSDSDRPVSHMRDVFLGGTMKDSSWKEEIAVPMLKQNGISFFNPKVSEWSNRFLPVEAAAMKNSYILLFVISDTARSIAEMAVAGYYIGLGARMVLCIQHFSNEATVGPDKLTENAIKDYNRGRMYLADIAKRNGVRIFSDVSDAVKCVVEECKSRPRT